MKHVSHFVKHGASLLKTSGDFHNLLAFQNPDNSIVLVIQSDQERELNIKIGSKSLIPKLKAGSFNTFVLKGI